jgi:hypothetical protein
MHFRWTFNFRINFMLTFIYEMRHQDGYMVGTLTLDVDMIVSYNFGFLRIDMHRKSKIKFVQIRNWVEFVETVIFYTIKKNLF